MPLVRHRDHILIAVLGLAAAALAWLSWSEYATIRELRAASLRSVNDGGRDRAAYERRIRELTDRLAALKGRASDAPAPPESAAQAAAAPAARTRGFAAFAAVMASPQFQKLAAIQQRGMLDTVYAALFKALNLSPQQLDQLKTLMVQRQQAAMDAMQAARDQGINPRTDPDVFRQAIAQAQATVDSQIQATLGDTAYAQYQQYQQTLPQRATVNQLQQSLSYTPTPLSDDQANQLIQILAQTSPQPQGVGAGAFAMAGPMGGPPGAGGARVTDQAVTLAQGVLSGPQVQALQQIQQQQLARQQMQQLMRAGRGGG
jgi:hypothetical protein